MAATAYKVANVAVTGTEAAPQTIAYADMTDIDGAALPTEFVAVPVIIRTPQQDRNAYIVAKTVTNFQIALGMAGMGPDSGTFDFIIIGESV